MTVMEWLDSLQVNFTKNSIVNTVLNSEIRIDPDSFTISFFKNSKDSHIVCSPEGMESTGMYGDGVICLQSPVSHGFVKGLNMYP